MSLCSGPALPKQLVLLHDKKKKTWKQTIIGNTLNKCFVYILNILDWLQFYNNKKLWKIMRTSQKNFESIWPTNKSMVVHRIIKYAWAYNFSQNTITTCEYVPTKKKCWKKFIRRWYISLNNGERKSYSLRIKRFVVCLEASPTNNICFNVSLFIYSYMHIFFEWILNLFKRKWMNAYIFRCVLILVIIYN